MHLTDTFGVLKRFMILSTILAGVFNRYIWSIETLYYPPTKKPYYYLTDTFGVLKLVFLKKI